jgi:hypothetical protein
MWFSGNLDQRCQECKEVKKCLDCDEPVEAAVYKRCKACWWAQDPRNKKNGGKVDLKEKPTIIINSPSHKDVNTTYEGFKAEWEGCIMCACDHGCNQWLARNAAKMLAITEELRRYSNDMPMSAADKLAQTPADEFGKRLWQRIRDEHTAKRKNK